MEIISETSDLKSDIIFLGEEIKDGVWKGSWTGYLSLCERKTGFIRNINSPLDSYKTKEGLLCALGELYRVEA